MARATDLKTESRRTGTERLRAQAARRLEEATVAATRAASQWEAGERTQAAAELETFAGSSSDPAAAALARGFAAYLAGSWKEAVACFAEACRRLEGLPAPDAASPFSEAFVKAQLNLPPAERPAVAKARVFYKKNLRALKEVDNSLAREVAKVHWPEGLTVIEYWDGLCLCTPADQTLYLMSDSLKQKLTPHLRGRSPIAFGGLGTGREVVFCLKNQVDLLHGMARPHYLFEEEVQRVKVLLHLADLHRALLESWLIIFCGSLGFAKSSAVFRSLRYTPPSTVIGDVELVKRYMDPALAALQAADFRTEAERYYGSAQFRLRQRRIALGEEPPRILVNTCRWTTFLKYCAADFDKAFNKLGCRTRFIIEETDTQTLLPALYFRELARFKPDAIFMISHARPSMPHIPKELPFIAFIQDKCGPLLTLSDLRRHISPADLFVCLSREHRRFLVDKGVPPNQTFLMPVPVDERIFHPLPQDSPQAERYSVQVSFVKHGTPHREAAFKRFISELQRCVSDVRTRRAFVRLFEELYRESCLNLQTCWYEPDMERFVEERLSGGVSDAVRAFLLQQVALFHCQVYSPAWRYRFLEALDRAGIELVLYGKNWEQNERLAHLSRGPVDRERELNYVYNFSAINLSINHSLSMTHRLAECALAGGFCLVAHHDPAKDYLPASDYFEPGRELVTFRSPEELVQKCRYFLAHPEKRRAIAGAMHERAVQELTATAGARRVLSRWRELLKRRL